MPVKWAEAAAGDLRSDLRQHARDLRSPEDLHAVVGRSRLVVQTLQEHAALLELLFAEREMEAAVALERHVETGLLAQLRGERRPRLGGLHSPPGVGRKPEPFALHPHEGEVRARGTLRHVAFVEHADTALQPAEAPGDGRAEQPAADNRDLVVVAHRPLLAPAV